mmetsp:Transcript_14729/g.51280  ORF Transcript_14729/g.51280 Transcript_14729/m.51280 type:complete len:340 (+) Transcript_14729:645-1664(+)
MGPPLPTAPGATGPGTRAADGALPRAPPTAKGFAARAGAGVGALTATSAARVLLTPLVPAASCAASTDSGGDGAGATFRAASSPSSDDLLSASSSSVCAASVASPVVPASAVSNKSRGGGRGGRDVDDPDDSVFGLSCVGGLSPDAVRRDSPAGGLSIDTARTDASTTKGAAPVGPSAAPSASSAMLDGDRSTSERLSASDERRSCDLRRSRPPVRCRRAPLPMPMPPERLPPLLILWCAESLELRRGGGVASKPPMPPAASDVDRAFASGDSDEMGLAPPLPNGSGDGDRDTERLLDLLRGGVRSPLRLRPPPYACKSGSALSWADASAGTAPTLNDE